MRGTDKPLRFEVHAEERMRERGVSATQIERTLRSPDKERQARRPGARRYEKAISSRRRLAVIAEPGQDFVTVITVWWM